MDERTYVRTKKCVENVKNGIFGSNYPLRDYFCRKICHIESAHTLKFLFISKELSAHLTIEVESTSEMYYYMCMCVHMCEHVCVPLCEHMYVF